MICKEQKREYDLFKKKKKEKENDEKYEASHRSFMAMIRWRPTRSPMMPDIFC